MNKHSNPFIASIIAVSILLFFSCEIKTTGINLGSLLSTGDDGHFTGKQIYYLDDSIYSFGDNGSYEYFSYSTDGTQADGKRGIYKWNSSTMILTIKYLYNYNSATDSWDDYKTEDYFPAYFTSSTFGEALLPVDGEDNTYMSKRTLKGVDTFTLELTTQYFIGSDSLIIESEMAIWDADSTLTSESVANVIEGDINGSYPSDTVWEKGATKSFNVYWTSAKRRQWDSGTADWEDWKDWEDLEDQPFNTMMLPLMTFTHFGSFLVYYQEIFGLSSIDNTWQAQKSLSLK